MFNESITNTMNESCKSIRFLLSVKSYPTSRVQWLMQVLRIIGSERVRIPDELEFSFYFILFNFIFILFYFTLLYFILFYFILFYLHSNCYFAL